jgi:phosphoenolpyruvate-protein phosphotransferase
MNSEKQHQNSVSDNRTIQGVGAAPGLASGPIIYKHDHELRLPEPYQPEDPGAAMAGISDAVSQVVASLEEMRQKVSQEYGADEAAIFEAHKTIVKDPALEKKVREALDDGVNPEAAWNNAVESFARMLENIPDPTLQARAADIRDVGNQVLAVLLGVELTALALSQPAIVAAKDLTPSETAGLHKDFVLGFCTEEGGATSHTAILAKALGIPAVVGAGKMLKQIPEGVTVLVDGDSGLITAYPTEEELSKFRVAKAEQEKRFLDDLKKAAEPALTRDGHQVEIAANIGNELDAAQAVQMGAEAVGLFRTEFLYLERTSLPTLNEQIKAYREVISNLEGRPLVVRTLDIGGDKQVDYLGLEEEPNPFLGWRAVRMISERPEVLEEQMLALLLAGRGTDLRVMIPMISSLNEVLKTRELLDNAYRQAQEQDPDFKIDLQFGIMVEVPSAALLVEQIAPHVDFFSIGTNDLTQYTLAVDRMNTRVAELASPFHPAVLKLIARVIRDGHHYQRWVGMCGEFAGDSLAVPFLLGAGLDEFSMAPAAIPGIKRVIRGYNLEDCIPLVDQVCQAGTTREVKAILETFAAEYWMAPDQES